MSRFSRLKDFLYKKTLFKLKIRLYQWLFYVDPARPGEAEKLYGLTLKMGGRDPEKGYLVSGFGVADYQGFINDPDRLVYVLRKRWDRQDRVYGFVYAYPSGIIRINPENASSVDQQMKLRISEPFVLVKQISTDPEIRGTGLGKKLYHYLFDITGKAGCVAAIVNQPPNQASIRLHEAVSFQWLTNVTPVTDDGVPEVQRSVWCRFPFEGRAYFGNKDVSDETFRQPYLNPVADRDEAAGERRNKKLDRLLQKSKDARALYAHEDNLNWTKIGMLTTFMTAFLTAASYLIRKYEPSTDLWLLWMTIAFGGLINTLFYFKITSGKMFFDSHKKTFRRYETRIYWLDPDLKPVLKGPLYRKSYTSKRIGYIILTSLTLYAMSALFLLDKAYGLFGRAHGLLERGAAFLTG